MIKRPLVQYNGELEELRPADTLEGESVFTTEEIALIRQQLTAPTSAVPKSLALSFFLS